MLGNKIKSLRKTKNYTQQDLADYLNVAKSTVAMWETNKREPDNATLITIANHFDITLDDLLGNKKAIIKNNDTPPDDDAIKFALFGTADIDDTLLDDVKKYAAVAHHIREEQENKQE